MATYRERREAKAARLQEWAAKRENKAEALVKVDEHLRHDWQFITQPGIARTSAWKHMHARDDQARELVQGADSMNSRAAGILDQADRAIYSDDPDALEQLRARIARLEAEQAAIKDFNAAMRRKGANQTAIVAGLPEEMRRSYLSTARFSYLNRGGGFPAYHLTNLGADIRRNRERLAQLERQQAPDYVEAPYFLTVKYPGQCRDCDRTIERGDSARYYRQAKELACYPACEVKE